MDRLWAPWRINYIRAKKRKGCIFCKGHYVIFKSKYSLVMLNLFPYNNGHLMVAPRRHVKDIDGLSNEEMMDLILALKQAKSLIASVLKPQGYNIGANLGSVAGAGITGHLHIHLVPRWKGDSNFMPVANDTKVISQSLDELYLRLKNAYAKSNKRVRR